MTSRRLVLDLLLAAAAALPLVSSPLTSSPALADVKPPACVDNTPHTTRMVEVEPGVSLEVVDWGGRGPWMVMITGGGDNAHVYDDFAYQFTDAFHVVGITRRGYLPSSQPASGYSVRRRALDDIAVLDALGIDKAVFVAHSAGGMELSRLGQAHPTRVDKLVYLDAADLSQRSKATRREPPGPDYTDADLSSLQAYQAAQARLQAIRPPLQATCLRVEFNRKGELVRASTPDFIPEAIDASVRETPLQNWRRIAAPRLGIYAPYTFESRQAWYWYLTPAQQRDFDRVWPDVAAWYARTIARFGQGATLHTLPGAPHYVYINNEAEVTLWMRDFLGVPPRRP